MPLTKKQRRKHFWLPLVKCNLTFTHHKPEVNASSLTANAGYGGKLRSSVIPLNSASISRNIAVSKWLCCWSTWPLCLRVLDLLKQQQKQQKAFKSKILSLNILDRNFKKKVCGITKWLRFAFYTLGWGWKTLLFLPLSLYTLCNEVSVIHLHLKLK